MGLVGEMPGCTPFGSGGNCDELIDDALQRLFIAKVVGELHLHVGQAKQRDGAHRFDVREAGKRHFDGDGDVAFHFLGGLAGTLRNDFDKRRDRIRDRLRY